MSSASRFVVLAMLVPAAEATRLTIDPAASTVKEPNGPLCRGIAVPADTRVNPIDEGSPTCVLSCGFVNK
jgi:hypothetical protein